jgi:hypothetical protein
MRTKTTRELYPYHVRFKRTGDWYGNDGTWYQISTWLREHFGQNWEYLDSMFMFSKEEHKMLFIMRWL